MVNKLKKIKILLVIGSFILICSCDFLNPEKQYQQINSNSEFNFIVNCIETKNGFIINKEYYSAGATFLQKKSSYSEKILKEVDLLDGELLDEYGQMSLGFWRIKPPYKIYKRKKSNILYLIKYEDTLQYRIYY